MRRVFRRILKGAAFLILIAVIAAALGTFVPRQGDGVDVTAGAETVVFRIATGIIHTDLAIRIDDFPQDYLDRFAIDGMPADVEDAEWLIIGWGSEAVYTSSPTFSDMRAGPLVKAFTLDDTVMRVAIIRDWELDSGSREYQISADQFDRFIEAVNAGFEGGIETALSQPGYGPSDRFYAGTGKFNALVGCNTWAANALRRAGLTTGWWNPLPQTLLVSLDLFN
jgi:uncharacterized protein (TIGR02117 family)